MLDYGYSLLNNPLLLIDMSFGYVASSGTGNLNDQPIWKYTIEHGIMPSDYVATIMANETQYLDSDLDDRQIISESPDTENLYKNFSIRVVQNKAVSGYLKVLEKNRDFTEFDQEVFLLLSKYVSIISGDTIQRHTFGMTLVENFLASILLRKLKGSEEIEARQSLFSVKLYENLHIITVKFRNMPDKDDAVYYTLRRLKSFFAKNIVTIINNSFVILYDSKNLEQALNKSMIERFVNLLADINCTANISLPFHKLDDVYRHYEQTLFCVDLRTLLQNQEPIVKYGDIFEYQMILNISQLVDMHSLLHPVVQKLLVIDKSNGSNLTETLFAFVKNHFNISTTAKAMFLHYNTLKHRINRITELTGFDPDDERDIFLILLSEKILVLLNQQKKENSL